MKWNLRGLKGVRAAAKRLADECAQKEARNEQQILEVVADVLGLESLELAWDILDGGVLGLTHVSGASAVITLSTQCVTTWHTLCHEIGHLMLGHSHVDGAQIDLMLRDCPPPPGFEEMHLHLIPTTSNGVEVEAEAEEFAVELLRLLNAPSGVAREWIYGLG